MNDTPHQPEDRPPLEELNDTLRRAVQGVRAEPLPRDALARAEQRALHMALPANGVRRSFPKRLLAISSLAAALLVGVMVWPGNDKKSDGTEETRVSKLDDGRTAEPMQEAKRKSLDEYRSIGEKALEASPNDPAKSPEPKPALVPNDETKGRERFPLEAETIIGDGGMSKVAGQGKGDDARGGFGGMSKVAGQGKGDGARGGLSGAGGMRAGGIDMGGQPGGGTGAGIGGPQAGQQQMMMGQMRGAGPAARPGPTETAPARRSSEASESGAQREKRNFQASGVIPPANPTAPATPAPPAAGDDKDSSLQKAEKSKKLSEELTDLKTSPTAANKDKDSKKEDKKQEPARVWHRDRQRPTFARVYIGAGNSLELVSLQVTVTIDGPRARTLVDHIFHNPHDRQLEGTFEYPLPSGASASYFAMFIGRGRAAAPQRFARRTVDRTIPKDAMTRLTPAEFAKQITSEDWGNLQEARVVAKEKALETYEEIVRGQIDPALLEYAGGNTFSGRVFPIPPRGYNRVLIAYEELLPFTDRGVQYRFALPQGNLGDLQFTLNADAEQCRDMVFLPREAKKNEGGGRVSFSHSWTEKAPGGDVLYSFTPPNSRVQAISGRQGESGPLYCYARIRPELDVATAQPFAAHAVFMLDTSLSEDPDRFGINMQLMRAILEDDPAIKRFNVLAFDVQGRWLDAKQWLPNTPEGRALAWKRLDGIVLEGATNMAAALARLLPARDKAEGRFSLDEQTPVNVFLLSDGQITWGDSEVAPLVARFESQCKVPLRFHCYRLGVGSDNQELFEALTRRGGGIFQCYSEADVAATANAHRHHCFQIDRISLVGAESTDLLVAGRKAAIYPGGELIAAARFNKPSAAELVLEGTFLGKRLTKKYALDVTGAGELAPRGWAEIAVASLLALNDPKLDSLVTAYCQQFGIGSRVASFLVLENPDDYKRLNLEAERGKTVPGGDLGRFLDEMWITIGKLVSPKESFERFLSKVTGRIHLFDGPHGAHVQKLIALLGEVDFAVTSAPLHDDIIRVQDVPPAYIEARQRDRRDAAAYLSESRRRIDRNDVGGAVRVLSSIIEEYPTRADALRLVGYRLLAMNQPAAAVHLFQQVQGQRPFEPHSYRDLARSLESAGNFGWAAVQYEIVLAGTWHNRFRDSLKGVALEEYVSMMRQAIQKHAVRGKLADQFGERLEQLASVKTQSDMRVTITWNSDATDVDLWVIEPDGSKCYYQNTRTKNGGELSQDQTQGYGPERYQIATTTPGVYTVMVHYYRANANLLAGETHVNVVVTQKAGTPQEATERYNVILKKADEQVEVCKVKKP